jgi:hypothetical protein
VHPLTCLTLRRILLVGLRWNVISMSLIKTCRHIYTYGNQSVQLSQCVFTKQMESGNACFQPHIFHYMSKSIGSVSNLIERPIFVGLTRNPNRNFLVLPVTSWYNQEGGLNFLVLPGILKHLQTSNQTNMQECRKLVTQEPKPHTLLLVGYWLRPEEFGFVCSLDETEKWN